MGSNKVRGGKYCHHPTLVLRVRTDKAVNLAGWGILERWITPSIFENVNQSLGIIDEFTLTQKLSRDVASGILNAHWSTFYTFRSHLQSLLDEN